MHVFLTGASGLIGSQIITELLAHGHSVTGLVRSDTAAAKVEGRGAKTVRGDLVDHDVIKAAAQAADGTIHCGFSTDYSKFVESGINDQKIVQLICEAYEGTNKPFILTSGVLAAPANLQLYTEAHMSGSSPRGVSEKILQSFAHRGVRAIIVRLSVIHGPNDQGFIKTFVDVAKEKKVSAYIADGQSKWPYAHVVDAAKLYRAGIEEAPAGSVLHAVAEEGVPYKEVAEAIGQQLGVPVKSIPGGEAADHFGPFFGMVITVNRPSSSEITQELLGWKPTEVGILEDFKIGTYAQ
ncbi:hypothetical protein P7C73_g1716, partial [Tremellales sp. Uapishka_1]